MADFDFRLSPTVT